MHPICHISTTFSKLSYLGSAIDISGDKMPANAYLKNTTFFEAKILTSVQVWVFLSKGLFLLYIWRVSDTFLYQPPEA